MKALKKLAALVLAGALCMSTFAGCGINPDDTAATLGEQKISVGLVNFLAKYQKAAMDDLYVGYFGTGVWDSDMTGSGVTLQQSLISSVVSNLHDLYTLKAHMADYKVALTDEEVAKIKEVAGKFMAANTEAALKELGATEEYVVEMLTLYTIQQKMYDAIIVDVDKDVKDEDKNMRGYSYVVINLEKHIVDGKTVKYTEAEIKALKENINKVAEALKNGTKLEDAVKEYKFEVEEGAYNVKAGDKTIDEEVMKVLKELKEGETSEMIEGDDDQIYFVRVDADVDKEATEDKYEEIIAERESKLYSDKVKEWEKNDGWVTYANVINQIDFHNIFTQDDGSTEKETGSEKETGTEKGTETSTEKGSEK
ncbi:MAG: peptidyl-prolyl cis-trans isomerase [Lachnospiraceae bacterium]|nr:peptidyl-prolyl cis-trans isomerase [Lachnospiraceae bacterium]